MLDTLQWLRSLIQSAATPAEAARALAEGLTQTIGPTAIALGQAGSRQIFGSSAPEVEAWLNSIDEPQGRVLSVGQTSDDLPLTGPALIAPLVDDLQTYGLMCVQAGDAVTPFPVEALALLADLLVAQLRYHHAERRWHASLDQLRSHEGAGLTELNEIGQILNSNLDLTALWDRLHEHLNILFDATSFFIGLYDTPTDQLRLPLVSEDGIRMEYPPIPLSGFSRAVVAHGLELYFQNVEEESERLAGLGITPDDREPGRWALSWIGVPLRFRHSEVAGLISIQNRLPYSYGDYELLLLTTVAGQISLALESLRLADAERERRAILNAVVDAGKSANSQADAGEIIEQILEQARRTIGYDVTVTLFPVEGCTDGTRMTLFASHDFQPYTDGFELKFSPRSPIAQVATSQQPLVLFDAQAHDEWDARGALPHAAEIRAWLAVPMIVQDRLIGLLTFGKYAPDGYSESDASVALALARTAALGIDHADLWAQAQVSQQVQAKRAHRLTSIHRVASVISSTLDRDEVLNTTAQLLTELFEADHSGVVMRSERDAEATLVVEYPDMGNRGLRLPLDSNTTMRDLAEYGTAIGIEDADADDLDEPTKDVLRRLGVRSTLFAPLIAGDSILGAVGVSMFVRQRVFTQDERETLMTVAGQVAMAVHNAALYEQALAANRLKSQFLTTVSHEFRTPLNAIIGYSDMLLNDYYGSLNEQQRDRMQRVYTGGNNLLNLINDVLDLSKIEAGQIALSSRQLRASTTIAQCIAEFAPRAAAKNLTLEMLAPPGEPPVEADPHYLARMISNLLDNAIKFTHEGGIMVRVYSLVTHWGETLDGPNPPPYLRVPDGSWVALAVTDTGIGIHPDNQHIIFESFRQVDGSSVREYGGTGLGLAIAQRLAALHGGYLWVESQPDKGSTFTLLLPSPAIENADATEPIYLRDERPLVIVLAASDLQQQAREQLTSDKYQLIGTNNPSRALQIARRLQADVLIADLLLPGANGWELLQTLNSGETAVDVPPILIHEQDGKAQSFLLGSAGYLPKQVGRAILLETLTGILPREQNAPLLLVSSSSAKRARLERWLSGAGYVVELASSGDEAIGCIERQPIALIILDLPLAQGLALLAEIRANPYTIDVPLLITVASDQAGQPAPDDQTATALPLEGGALLEQVKAALFKRRRTS